MAMQPIVETTALERSDNFGGTDYSDTLTAKKNKTDKAIKKLPVFHFWSCIFHKVRFQGVAILF
jgi:hypothetical protein